MSRTREDKIGQMVVVLKNTNWENMQQLCQILRSADENDGCWADVAQKIVDALDAREELLSRSEQCHIPK